MATNAFEALLTPETLQARRMAELQMVNAREPNFWVQQANRTGADIRKTLREHGIGLTKRDKQAAYNQAILQQAAQSAAAMVKDGMDPNEARSRVLENAAREFLANGNYQEADELLGQVDQIRQMQAERAKLLSTAANQASMAENRPESTAAGTTRAQAAATTAAAREALVPSQQNLNRASADLKDRTDPNLRGSGGSAGADINKSQVAKVRDTMVGWLGYSEKAEQIANILARAPRTGTKTAGLLTPILQEISSLAGVTPASTAQVLARQPEDSKAAYSAVAGEIKRTADRLGVNFSLFNSLVIDLAYARARINDPGGRISDKDFKAALDAIGASGDAGAFASTLRNDLRNTWQQTRRQFTGNKMDTEDEPLWVEGRERASTLQLLDQPTGKPVSAPSGKTETAKERFERIKRSMGR